jgi:hypothetical protein
MVDENKPGGMGAGETENDPFIKRIFDRGAIWAKIISRTLVGSH